MDELTTYMENHCIVIYSPSYLRTGDFEGFIMNFLVMSIQTHDFL